MSNSIGSRSRNHQGNQRQNYVLPPRLEVPLDEDDCRYMKSFLPDQGSSQAAAEFFDKYGFIIFRDVLSAERCHDTVADMWALLNEKHDVVREDPQTWSRGLHQFGMPKGAHGLFRPSLLSIRQDSVVHTCFSSVLGKDEIIVNHDRWLLHRPTRNIDGSGVNVTEWETARNIHLDLNPWDYFAESNKRKAMFDKLVSLPYHESRSFVAENNIVHESMGRSVQGILTLGDIMDVGDGGTIVVPGFHRVFEEWAKGLGEKTNGAGQFRFQDSDPLQSFVQHVTMRKGSLLIWDQRLAHGSTPNRSSCPRYAIPIRFFDADLLKKQPKRAVDRSIAVRHEVEKCGFAPEVTELGQRVFNTQLKRR